MLLMTLILTSVPTASVSSASVSLSQGWVYALLALLLLVMAGLSFTPYRYVLGYFLSGMGYWLMIEGLQWLVSSLVTLPLLSSYAWAIGLSLIPLLILLSKFDEVSASATQINFTQILLKLSHRIMTGGKALFARKTAPTLPPAIAGQKPLDIFKDTNYCQHFIQHSPVFEYKN